MDRSKFSEFFNPEELQNRVNIVGVGAIGSNICLQLTRLGIETIHIYDFDTVDAHNIANQMYDEDDINELKVNAIARKMKAINPHCNVITHEEGLQEPYILNGYIFMCVDSIELRKEITEANRLNRNTSAIFDFRMRLTDAQYYCAKEDYEYDELLKTMNFTHEEAQEATPTSACGIELSVIYAPNIITSFGISNFVKISKNENYDNIILIDTATTEVEHFKWKNKKKKSNLGLIDRLITK